MAFYSSTECENSCDALLWSKEGDKLFVSFYDRLSNETMKGSIQIYDFSIENYQNQSKTGIIQLNQTVDNQGHGILHIAKLDEQRIFVADTSGTINMLEFQEDIQEWQMKYGLCDVSEASMCLYLDFQHCNRNLWYSCQNGHIGLAKYDGISEFKNIKTYMDGHKFEAWYICSFNEHIAISGGDDGKVFIWDDRVDKSVGGILKYFNCGVTSITNIPMDNSTNLFMVGGFDESISIWDLRSNFRQPVKHFENLGGQIWRIRWDPLDGSNSDSNSNPTKLVCAMMQSESAVYELNPTFDELKQIHKNNSSAQLVYGVEWHPFLKNLIVSCSHKDKLIELYNYSNF